MKILQLIPTLLDGGAEKFVCELSIELMNSGHSVLLVQIDSRKGSALPKLVSKANLPHLCLWRKRFLDINFFFRLLSLLIRYKPDVIHTHLGSIDAAFLLILLYKCKCKVHTFHTIAEREAASYGIYIRKILFKKLVKPIAVSKSVAETVRKKYAINPHVIYNGVRFPKVSRAKNISNREFTFLTIGRLEKVKNNSTIIKSFAKFIKENPKNKSQLLVIGNGSEKDLLHDLIKILKIQDKVRLLGFQEGVDKYLYESDVLINASDYEGCSLTLLEALLSGINIFSRDIPSNREILGLNASYFKDETGLIELMKRSCLTKRARNKLINAERFLIEDSAKKYLNFYKKYTQKRMI